MSLPAACIFDLNSTRWFYDLPDGDVLAVSSRAVPDRPELVFEAVSEQGRTYELCLTFQMVMGEHAWLHAVALEQTDQVLTIRQPADLCDRSPYPELRMDLLLPEGAIVGDDRVLRAGDGAVSAASSEMLSEVLDPCLLTVCCTTSALRLDIRATLDDASSNTNPSATPASPGNDFATAQRASHTAFAALTADFTLEAPARADADTCRRIEAINTTVWWYAHNAMIHYAAPHGIEQPGGAAWGTRDVCQGPLEFFLAFGQHARARATLLRLFAHQSAEHGEWPQWFMFDRYRGIFAQDCHGDVVFWPLFALAQYLEATHDAAILDEPVPFAEPTPASPAPTPLRTHVVRALAAITPRLRTVNGQPTALVSYAGGDWDDTLQPAHAALKERLVSAWTQALASQTMARLGSILLTMQASADAELAARLTALGAAMAADFHRYLICDGVIAGFASLEDDGLRYLLHPRDTTTGIKYRLLPLTRSIIAGLADRMLTARNIALMDAHLAYPDGMRLMDRPARYQGGISHIFQRAEQAAHVGREISLQYVHAHIRYLEAMCAAGEADRVWEGLFAITPPVLREHVPHAGLRQSNAYFSSSDGAYPDRYVYQDTFDRLRRGDIAVNGGWRVYSSGPGIYIRQVVQGLCGVRRAGDKLVLDPTLPLSTHTGLDGLALRLDMPDLPPLRIVWTLGAPPAATPPAASVAIHTAYCNGQPVAFSRLPDLPCRLHARGGISLPVACLTPGTDGICTLTMELK